MPRHVSFIFIFISLCILGNCNECVCDRQPTSKLETLAAVLEDQGASVLDLSKQRAYLDPQNLSITDEGLVIYEAGTRIIILPELHSAYEGYFVSCSEADLKNLANQEDIRIWWCDTCRSFRSMDKHGRCNRCGRHL